MRDFGLVAGEPIRFRHRPRGNWHYGQFRAVEKDGSLRVFDDQYGHARSLPPEIVQRKTSTARGRTVWLPLCHEQPDR